MPLTRVSLTGPDDATKVEDLMRLSLRYPFVEWAILYSPKRAGSGRYPAAAWRHRFENACGNSNILRAIHLCGQGVKTFAAAGPRSVPIAAYQRVQLNANFATWPEQQVSQLLAHIPNMVRWDGHVQQAIVQHNKNNAPYLTTLSNNTDVLYDASGGYGKTLTDIGGGWPDHFTGYAGGLNPDNVVDVFKRIQDVNKAPFYMDMESGIRTNDLFDIKKAEAVLNALAPYVTI